MKFLKRLFHFYVFSNLHVALAGFALTRITEINNEINNYFASLFVGFSIVISYNFIRFFEVENEKLIWFHRWFKSNSLAIITVSFIAFLGLGYLVFQSYIKLNAILFVIPFGFMTLFYVIPLFKIGRIEISFRNFPFVKIFSIAIAWAGITTFFPMINGGIHIVKTSYLELLIRFLFVFTILIPFDIRDIENDSKQLKTIPQILGIKGAKLLGAFCILLFVWVSYFSKSIVELDVVLIGICTLLLLLFSSPKNNRFYSSFWVEGVPVLWLLIIMYFR